MKTVLSIDQCGTQIFFFFFLLTKQQENIRIFFSIRFKYILNQIRLTQIITFVRIDGCTSFQLRSTGNSNRICWCPCDLIRIFAFTLFNLSISFNFNKLFNCSEQFAQNTYLGVIYLLLVFCCFDIHNSINLRTHLISKRRTNLKKKNVIFRMWFDWWWWKKKQQQLEHNEKK